MGRLLTILGVSLLFVGGAIYLEPWLTDAPEKAPRELLRPPRPALPRTFPTLTRALLGKDEHEALAALDRVARGDAEGALLRIDDILGDRGESAPRLAVLGLVLLGDGKMPEAGEAFERALTLSPRDPLALYGRARLRIATRRYPRARRDLVLLTRERPGHPETWRLLALACLGTGDGEAAFRAAERAVALAPGNRNVLRTTGACLLRLGREEEAAIWTGAAGSTLTATR
jgi:tetratricopeptide (TPR) repeat protein